MLVSNWAVSEKKNRGSFKIKKLVINRMIRTKNMMQNNNQIDLKLVKSVSLNSEMKY